MRATSGVAPPSTELFLAARRCATVAFLGVLPVIGIKASAQDSSLAFDFHRELYPEAKLVLHGHNPYPPVDADLSDGQNTVWPVAAVLPLVPLTFLSAGAADWVWTGLVLGCL